MVYLVAIKFSSIRASQFYKDLDSYTAAGLAEGFIDGSNEERTSAWQWLHDTGIGYKLQGFFGRTLEEMLLNKIIQK